MSKLVITLKNGDEITVHKSEFDSWTINYGFIIIKKNMQWIKVYNVDCVQSVEVK